MLNKKLLTPSLILISFLILASCTDNNTESDDKKSTNNKECFIKYRNQVCDLMTIQNMATILGITQVQITQSDNSHLLNSSPDLVACLYKTASETKLGTISVGQLKTEEPNIFKTKYNNEYYNSNGRETKYLEEKIGDAAVVMFISGSTNLVVLNKSETFTIQIYGNNKSNEENLEIAIKVAKEVVKICS